MNIFKNKKILLIVCGGIAAYKSLEIIRLLKKKDAQVKTILTKNANKFITPLSVVSLSQEKVYSDLFDHKNEISLSEEDIASSIKEDLISSNNDELYSKAVDIVIKQQKVSTSYVQRYLQIGYNRAARIIEKMEEDGIISEANNAGKRHVLKK